MTGAERRAALLVRHRGELLRLFQQARQDRGGEDLAGYVVTVSEPTGYLLAAALQRFHGGASPDEAVRIVLETPSLPPPVLSGVMAKGALVDLLTQLSPNLAELAKILQQTDASERVDAAVSVLVAASGGAEILPLAFASG